MANKDVTVDANFTTMTSVDRTNDRLLITDAGSATLQDVAPETLVPYASAAETTTGTEAAKAVTPDGLAGSDFGIRAFTVEVFAATTPLSTGDGKKYVAIPNALASFNIIRVHATLFAKSTSGTPTVQIARGRQANATTAHAFSDVLSTRITVDQDEYDSRNAATAPVINTSFDDLAAGDLLRFDVDVTGTAATGLWITVEVQKP